MVHFQSVTSTPLPSMATSAACQSMTMTGTLKMGFFFFFLIIMISQRNMSTASLLKNSSHFLLKYSVDPFAFVN